MPEIATCINCGRTEADSLVVSLRFQGRPFWACTACMPVVIHKTDQLADKLSSHFGESRNNSDG